MSCIIAVDAMGGDHAPLSVLEGIRSTITKTLGKDIRYLIFGLPSVLEPLLENQYKDLIPYVQFIESSSSVPPDAKPSYALRHLKNSSMFLAINSVKHGQADFVVSAGNTGALMAMSMHILRCLPNIERPCLVSFIPSFNLKMKSNGFFLLLDAGANVSADEATLLNYSFLGSTVFQCLTDRIPRVALLNVGSEEKKGRTVEQNVFQHLKTLTGEHFTFSGFLEPHHILFQDQADVIVTDGFSGNILLKSIESSGHFTSTLLKSLFKSNMLTAFCGLICKPFLKKFSLNPDAYNGAPLLGLNHLVLKCHGSAKSLGFLSVFLKGITMTENNFIGRVNESLRTLSHIKF